MRYFNPDTRITFFTPVDEQVSMPLLKLTEISIRKCIRHSTSIQSVGDLPYHMVKPILQRLPARQLDIVEQNSHNVMPYSDELWIELIEKDFPSRPIKIRGLSSSKMKYKSLYQKYNQEQENFRKDSTERLKKLTKMLEKKKTQNSVVQVEQVLRDPTVRVPSVSMGNRNSILNKARRELLNRPLMFRRDVVSNVRPVRPPVRPTPRSATSKRITKPLMPLAVRAQSVPPLTPSMKLASQPNALKSPLNPMRSPPDLHPKPPPKPAALRRPKSSPFLSPKRPKRPRPAPKPNEVDELEKSNIKSIKSSVFTK